MDVIVKNKEIRANDLENLIVVGDHESFEINFIVDNNFDDNYIWYLQHINKFEEGESVKLIKSIQGSKIHLKWKPSKLASKVEGILTIQIFAKKNDKYWYSRPYDIYVAENLNPKPIIQSSPTVFLQYIGDMEAIAARAEAAKESASNSKDSVDILAKKAKASEEAAKDSENKAKISQMSALTSATIAVESKNESLDLQNNCINKALEAKESAQIAKNMAASVSNPMPKDLRTLIDGEVTRDSLIAVTEGSNSFKTPIKEALKKSLTSDILSLDDTLRTISLQISSLNSQLNEVRTLANNLPATNIRSEKISLDRLPKGALDELVIVANESAMLALRKDRVQKGDTVKLTESLKMYYVTDDTKLGSMAAFTEYTAARASAVDWSGIENKPSLSTPSEVMQLFDEFISIGDIVMKHKAPISDKFLICDGSKLNISDYPELFAVIGQKYKKTNYFCNPWDYDCITRESPKIINFNGQSPIEETTCFNLPDFRGVFLRGYGEQTFDVRWQDTNNEWHSSQTTYKSEEIGKVQTDAIRNISGSFEFLSRVNNLVELSRCNGVFKSTGTHYTYSTDSVNWGDGRQYNNSPTFNVSTVVPTNKENRPLSYAINYYIRVK